MTCEILKISLTLKTLSKKLEALNHLKNIIKKNIIKKKYKNYRFL